MPQDKMDDALDAYLRLLDSKGADAGVIAYRRRILARLNQILRSQRGGTDIYRAAVDALLSLCPPGDRAGAMTAAREYYYFWLDDVKKLAALNARDGFTTHHIRLPAHGSFESLQQRMQSDGFTQYPPSLDIYLGQLYELGSDENMLAERGELIRPLLYLLHGHPHHPDSFRTAIDAMLLHLGDSQARDTFLIIAREFFYYWISFPDAGVRAAPRPA